MSKKDLIEELNKKFPEAMEYILDDLKPFKWKSLGLVKNLIYIQDDLYFIEGINTIEPFTPYEEIK